MKKTTKYVIHISLLIFLSIIVATLSVSGEFKPGDVSYNRGIFIGHILALIILPVVLASIVAFISERVKTNSKGFSFIIMWIAFFVMWVAVMHYTLITGPSAMETKKLQFTNGCVDGYKQQTKTLAPNAQKIPDSTIRIYCSKISNLYFDCVEQGGEPKNCLNKAVQATQLTP